eukprot:13487238-Alexandrium_andersonii.AAC.1
MHKQTSTSSQALGSAAMCRRTPAYASAQLRVSACMQVPICDDRQRVPGVQDGECECLALQ